MSADGALLRLAEQLRGEDTVISEHVVRPEARPALGPLAAAGPRAAAAPDEYSFVLESVREGYLLHYGRPRILTGQDPDLALLAGDYLYAIGLERLARLGDAAAVHELSDLIGLSAALHTEGAEEAAPPLWLGAAMAIGCGSDGAHVQAKSAARAFEPEAGIRLWESARALAAAAGLEGDLDRAAEAIDFAAPETRGG